MKYPISSNGFKWIGSFLNERFGGNWCLHLSDQCIVMSHEGIKGCIIFDRLFECFYSSNSNFKSGLWDSDADGWCSALGRSLPTPGFHNIELPIIEKKEDNYYVHYDLIGLIYWNLSRIEEIESSELDSFGRFSAKSSHAYRNNYLDRPIIDEWLHILSQIILRICPNYKLKENSFCLSLSHDVDEPSAYCFEPWRNIIRMMGGHLIRRGDLFAFLRAPIIKLVSKNKFHNWDEFNQFDWLMECSESVNVKSTFYFMAGRSDFQRDGKYEIDDPKIVNLMREIDKRGHKIGIHPSYLTYQSKDKIQFELNRLNYVVSNAGISQSALLSRMHYLRWENPTTLIALDGAGVNIDSTLGYADCIGFRSGTCFSYHAFDAVSQSQKKLRLQPLIAMDCSVTESAYMGLGIGNASRDILLNIKDNCRRVNGTFSLLWHNSNLIRPDQRRLYLSVISQ
jgi:hypothetical protein